MSDLAFQAFVPPGPIAQAYYESLAPVSVIMGPIGSAKTSTALMKIILRAALQEPSPVDGVRYTKFAVVRDTFTNLEATTLPSWHTWVPEEVGKRRGGNGRKVTHELEFDLGRNGKKDIIKTKVEFIGLGDLAVEVAMRGWEGTGAYLNEMDTLSPDVLTYLLGRVGRYPSKKHGGPTYYGIWGDMNAPDDDNYTYEKLVENLPKSWEFYRQPGGMEAGAENLENLPDGYYQNQMNGQPDWYIRRFIHNLFGYSRDGEPVYSEFNDHIHVAPAPLKPIPGLPVILGGDQGRTPAVTFGQQLPDGRWQIFHELCAENMGAKQFGELLAKELHMVCPGFDVQGGWGDPAGGYMNDHDEVTWLHLMTQHSGVRWKGAPLPSNALEPRLECVRTVLTRLIDGKPGILISPICKKLRKGFNSGYHFRRVAIGGGQNRMADKPNKNEYSHVQDSLQYLLIGGGEYREVMGRKKAMGGARRSAVAKHNFSIFGGKRR